MNEDHNYTCRRYSRHWTFRYSLGFCSGFVQVVPRAYWRFGKIWPEAAKTNPAILPFYTVGPLYVTYHRGPR